MTPTFPHPVYSRHVLQPAYDDAQAHLFRPMLAAHEAHALALGEAGVISPENVQAILAAVATIRQEGADGLAYQPGIEDLFFRVEAQIIERAGEAFGGNLQLARSRNDLGQALSRMALRQVVLDVADALLALQAAVLACGQEHLHTVMPGYTHTQPAQPTTFAHYLAGVLSFLAKDQQRFAQAFDNLNESPLGAAAFTGTGFPIDRQRLADLLGFARVIPSTHHSIGAGDHLTDAAFAVQSLCIGLSRLTKDLLFFATAESGALRIDDSFIQISSIMPQKRNPVVLEHLRARLSRASGYAQAVVLQCHGIPYGDTQDIEDEILPPLLLALSTCQDCLELYTAVFQTLRLNTEHLAQRAGAGFSTATELADVLVRGAGLPFRTAHKIVAETVQQAVRSRREITLEAVQASARKVCGRPVRLNSQQLAQALDPVRFVASRTGLGGAAASATGPLLDDLAEQLRASRARCQADRTDLRAAAENRRREVAARLQPILTD